MGDDKTVDTHGTIDDVARWIWKNLVPKSGQADTIQGELLRAIEKLRWEAQSNGNINWDRGFEILLNFLQSTLCSERSFSRETQESISKDLNRLRNFRPPNELEDDSQILDLPYTDDDLYDRLTEHVVAFCRAHPVLLPLERNLDLYR